MKRTKSSAPRFVIARVRLVGFHNFVDETIEIGSGEGDLEGGHLFLLGDNGSGKTTVLDAIHLVLTGADVELNAAARVGRRRDGGRSLAGIVLRHHAERGVVSSGNAIAYAAIELSAGPGEARLVIGVGLAATTLEAHVTRWGFVRPGTLEGVPLVRTSPDGKRAVTRDELDELLGGKVVFARIADYRARVADALFGGETAYENACRLWTMAKSYREMAASTRDFGGLFERFLPAPSTETLREITTSLRQIDELETGARALEEQRAYVARVSECLAEVGAHREERLRLDRAALWLEREAAREELSEIERERTAAHARLREAADATATAEACVAHADQAVLAARTGPGAALVAELCAAEREVDARRRDVESAERAVEAARRRCDADTAALAEADDAVVTSTRDRQAAARAAVEDASCLPWLLPRGGAAAAGDETALDDGLSEVGRALSEARAAHADADARARVAESARAEAEAALASARASATVDGDRGASGALEALALAGVEAAPLFELIEPRADADSAIVASLEALVPSGVWHTIVARPEDTARARVVLAERDGARLGVRVVDAQLPTWVDALIAPASGALAQRGRALLAAELVQHGSLGPVEAPDALGAAELRGVTVRASVAPRLLGRSARLAAHEVRVGRLAIEAQVRIEAASACSRAADASLAVVERLATAEGALRALSSRDAREVRALRLERARALAYAGEALAREQRAADVARQALASAEHAAAALRASAEGRLEVEALALASKQARAAHESAVEHRTRCASRTADLDRRHEDLHARLAMAAAALDHAMAGAAPLAIEEASLTEVERARAEVAQLEHTRVQELLSDGSRGLREPRHSSRFGLAMIEPRALATETARATVPRVEDRRGMPIANVLAELDRSVEEARAVVNEKTRELFDLVVVGTLARQLQTDVEGLHATVSGLNELLSRAQLGGTRYAFRIAPRAERAELVSLVRRMSVLDPASRTELRAYIEGRRAELTAQGDERDHLLDYRRWFDYRLVTRAPHGRNGSEETALTREVRAVGSGGEQGVPNHLLVLALARLTFDAAGARVCPLLLDEAFQGIDAVRREGLLGFATELGLQLIVASPDQDGVVAAARSTTTLFVAKDEHGDVHLAPYHYWHRSGGAQKELVLTPSA